MKIKWLPSKRMMVAGLLGSTVLLSGPLPAGADQGKWWNPTERGRTRTERRSVERVRTHRDNGLHRGWDRRYRQWRGTRIYRDYVVIRQPHRPYFRAWRYYARPYFVHRQHICYVRPVRYWIGASFALGGVGVSARFHDPDAYLYGCNFCDARFTTFGAYHRHVLGCEFQPEGYRVSVRGWNDDSFDEDWWWENHGWTNDEEWDD